MNRKATALLLVAVLACSSVRPATGEQNFFAFRSHFWLNLHHYLRVVARGMPSTARFAPEEQQAWDAAVAFYKSRYAERDLLHDEGMSRIRVALRGAREKSLEGVAIPEDLRATLASAAPVYRQYFWVAHNNANRTWISAVEAHLGEHGQEIAERVARSYGEDWPAEPIPVDVTVSAGPNGAYAAFPPHVVVSSVDEGHRGLAALESVFHEASHQWGRRLAIAISEAEKRHGKEVPRGLWHAVLFYNAGEITRDVLSKHGVPGYVENAIKGGMYEDFCGASCRELIVRHWQAVIEGKSSFETALDRIVADWPPKS